MHSGFKGTRIGLTSFNLKEKMLNYEIAFIDSDGVTHATMRHATALIEGSELNKKVEELATMLIGEGAKMHFDSPAGEVARSAVGGTRGIAEALGDTGVSADEPEGTPG